MVFPNGLVKFTVVLTHFPSNDSPNGDKVIIFIGHYDHPTFVRKTLNKANPRSIGNQVDNTFI